MRLMSAGMVAAIARSALRGQHARLAAAAGLSMAINLIHLAAPAYALYVLTHLPGRERLSLLAGATLAVMVVLSGQVFLLEWRRQVLRTLAAKAEAGIVEWSRQPSQAGRQALMDLEAALTVLGGRAGAALCDLPWLALFLAASFWLDPLLGATVVVATGAGMALLVAAARRDPAPDEGLAAGPVAARGRRPTRTLTFARVVTVLAATFAFALSLALDAGQFAAAGVAVAASLLTARALSIVRAAIAVAPEVTVAVRSLRRLARTERSLLVAAPTGVAPQRGVRIEDMTVAARRAGGPAVSMHLRLRAGEALAIVGDSGCGKSLLARALAGLEPAARGRILLDGMPLAAWAGPGARHVGYLPQDPALAEGTVAEVIAGFDPTVGMPAVVAAAAEAGVHDLVCSLPQGYGTRVGPGGFPLSAGECQRLALARALCGSPFLVVLDDPVSRLDAAGELALGAAILSVRVRGGIVISLHQRPPRLAAFDRLAVIEAGRVRSVRGFHDPSARRPDNAASRFADAAAPDILSWGRQAPASR